jgi:hypothetical protein
MLISTISTFLGIVVLTFGYVLALQEIMRQGAWGRNELLALIS